MFNVGGGEFLVIMLVALIVLGPTKLPEAARQIGSFAREIRRISSGFQEEFRNALDEPIEDEARSRGRRVVSSEQRPAPAGVDLGDASVDGGPEAQDPPGDADEPVDDVDRVVDDRDVDDHEEASAEPEAEPEAAPMSTAEAAGMYDIVARRTDDRTDDPGTTG